MPRIRAVWVRASGNVNVVNVENTGPALGQMVGGFLEVFYVPNLTTDPMDSVVGLCDEEGWTKDNPVHNPYSMLLHARGMLAGDVLLVRARVDGEFTDLTVQDLRDIQALLGVRPVPTGVTR